MEGSCSLKMLVGKANETLIIE